MFERSRNYMTNEDWKRKRRQLKWQIRLLKTLNREGVDEMVMEKKVKRK